MTIEQNPMRLWLARTHDLVSIGLVLRSGLVAAAIGIVLLFQNCAGDFNTVDIDKLRTAADLCRVEKARLDSEARVVMTNACSSCHAVGGTSADPMNRFFSVYDPLLMKQSGDIAPGSADSSLVYLKIAERNHPSPGLPSESERQTIRSWLDRGFRECETNIGGPPTTSIRYVEIQSMLRDHGCLTCHDQPMSAFGNVGFGAYAEAVKTVDRDSPEFSRLYLSLDLMAATYPAQVKPFAAEEKAKILEWISGGAPE